MKSRRPVTAFTPHEIQQFAAPLALTSILILAIIALDGALAQPLPNLLTIVYGVAGMTYILVYSRLVASIVYAHARYTWMYSIVSGVGLGLLTYILPTHLSELVHIMIVLITIAVVAAVGRLHAYIALLAAILISFPGKYQTITNIQHAVEYFEPFLLAVVALETYVRIRQSAQQYIHRLETINKVSRQLMQSLETEQVLSLLSETILDTLEADSYFVGVLKGDNIRLELLYDDGEFFNGTELPLDGTLSGWVIRQQKELFLPDLREEVHLDGVDIRIIGKEKTSLSWLGVPLRAANITGIMAMAAYQPNAFDQADLELLSSLAQHVTLALDNTIRHAQVEERARLDSLTQVYNHGYFLKKLSEQSEVSSATNTPLSLIMLDIDYFKQYNDTFGHLVGDQILTSLGTAIKQHIKQGDAVGRWGGEEFVISLPHANGEQALQVARRIGETMARLRVEDREHRTIPVPTVSQGIAVFPYEADEIYRLIDLADRRLYVAKERGRNQIEPHESHWIKIQKFSL